MKAMMITNRMKKMLTSILAISLFTTVSFSQGLLLESISYAVQTLSTDKTENETYKTVGFSEASLAEQNSLFLFKRNANTETSNRNTSVIRSFNVAEFDLVMEEELEAENWMTAPLALEEAIETEAWMVEPLTSYGEQSLRVEDWMTEPLNVNNEEEIVTEEWMTKLFF